MKKLFLLVVLPLMFIGFVSCEKGEDIEPEISIAKTYISFSDKGGDTTISIDANFEYDVSSQASWVTAKIVYGGVLISVKSNPDTLSRYAIVVVYNEEYGVEEKIEVYQSARPYKIGDLVTKGNTQGIVFETTGSHAKMVSQIDSYDALTYAEAHQWCKNLSGRWRLPTVEELLIVFSLRSTLNIAFNHYYWTSTSYSNGCYEVVGVDGRIYVHEEDDTYTFARAVCDL